MRIFQKGFHYRQDGPGNRLVYHLQGCNLRCKWCANPESFLADGNAQDYPIADCLNEIMRSKLLFSDGGGVTFTGGEATLQYDQLFALLTQLKAHGINTCIETNATHPALPALFELCDHLIVDCKHYDSAVHKAFTGAQTATIHTNIKAALAAHPSVLVRIPLVHGFNDAPEDIDGFIALFHTMAYQNCSVELLPYHEYGKDKWLALGLVYEMSDGHVSSERLAAFSQRFCQAGLQLIQT